MYPHFIEVHSNKDPQMELMLNVDHINYFYVNEDGVTKIMLSDLRYEEISESYDQLQKLITGSGCLINKGDPRLENKPLTMDDLVRMVGQPGYNSNLSRWHLVENTEPDEYRGSVVILKGTHSQVWYYDSADLIRHPLYRMKEEK